MFTWIHAKTFCLYYKVRKRTNVRTRETFARPRKLFCIKADTMNLLFHGRELSFKLSF